MIATRHCERAKRARQSIFCIGGDKDGWRRFARNDGVTALPVMPAKAGIHDFLTAPIRRPALTYLLVLFGSAFVSSAANAESTIPFIGCASSGMMKMAAPTGKSISLDLPANIASKLAIFAGAYQAVLGPRTWRCSGGLGNDSQLLSVFQSRASDGSKGEIEVGSWGEGSGATQAMSFAGRYFPKLVDHTDIKTFMTARGMDGVTEAQFIAPYYPASTLLYLTSSAFAFTTRANETGIESELLFPVSALPKSGIVKLEIRKDNFDLSYMHWVVVSLPPNLSYLQPTILAFSKKCILHADKSVCEAAAKNNPAVPTIP